MCREERSLKDAIEALPSVAPLIPNAASFQLGWMGLQAVRYRDSITNEFSAPPISQHALVLVTRPPEQMNMQYEGLKRDKPPAAGSVALVPAGSAALWRWEGSKDLRSFPRNSHQQSGQSYFLISSLIGAVRSAAVNAPFPSVTIFLQIQHTSIPRTQMCVTRALIFLF